MTISFLKYLGFEAGFFGKTERDLKNFALRDLGVLGTNTESSFQARFADGDEARACFHYIRLLDRFEVKSAGVYQEAISEVFRGPECPTDYAADLRSRAACQAGQYF